MSESLKKRLLALEQGRTTDRKIGGVVTYGRNETQNEALERARSEGITGPVLLVPSVMTYEEWAAMMEKEANCDRPDE
jgi:hypothetical protein